MSYIRYIGNPDNLYIWGDSNGRVTISQGSKHPLRYIPKHVFEGVLYEYHRRGEPEQVKYRGATFREANNPDYCILSYKDWSVTCYYVTWYYVIHSNPSILSRYYVQGT